MGQEQGQHSPLRWYASWFPGVCGDYVCNALNLKGVIFSSLILTKFRRYSLFSSYFAPSNFQSSIVTGVRITCKQKPKLTWLLHHVEAYFFCLRLCLIMRPSRFGLRFTFFFRLAVVPGVGFLPGPQSSPTQPSPAPGAPTSPMRAPPPLSISFSFPA
jgi:hypothetical protein